MAKLDLRLAGCVPVPEGQNHPRNRTLSDGALN